MYSDFPDSILQHNLNPAYVQLCINSPGYPCNLLSSSFLQLQAVRCGNGALSLRGNASAVAALQRGLEVEDGGLLIKFNDSYTNGEQIRTYVSGDSVVPNDDSVGRPLHTGLVLAALVDVVVEEVQDSVFGEAA